MDVKVLCVNLIQLGPSPFNSLRQCKKSSLRHHFRHNSRKLGSQKLLPQVNFQCGSKNIFSQCQRSRGYIWAKYSHRLPPGEISSDLYRDQFLGKFLNSSHLIFIFMFLTQFCTAFDEKIHPRAQKLFSNNLSLFLLGSCPYMIIGISSEKYEQRTLNEKKHLKTSHCLSKRTNK